MPRKQKSFFYVYKTTCIVTGRYYVGMHATSNLEDGYMGSGRRLKYSIQKHGLENHTKEILEFLPNQKELTNREIQLVNDDLLKDPKCMNLMRGGEGGFISKEQQANRSRAGGIARANHMKTDPAFKENLFQKNSTAQKKRVENGMNRNWQDNYSWLGKTHTAETKKKMSDSHKNLGNGEKNSQYGTMWITDGVINKKIRKTDTIPSGWKAGRR